MLVFGGSDGGLSGTLVAALLAAHGYPALALAYFNAPGLPAQLSDIPLEYFATALRWLRAQPQVDPRHVLTLGVSRGSEAALLLGAYYQRLVDGVIAKSQRRRDLLLSQLERARLDAARPARCPTPSSSTTRTRSTTPPRSSRSSGSAARSSSIAAVPTRSGSPARTPGPS